MQTFKGLLASANRTYFTTCALPDVHHASSLAWATPQPAATTQGIRRNELVALIESLS